jgi:hypothetical protein
MDNNHPIPLNKNNLSIDTEPINLDDNELKSFQSLFIFNDNLRRHIKLSLSIYKKLNNFDHKYIHQYFAESLQDKKSSK